MGRAVSCDRALLSVAHVAGSKGAHAHLGRGRGCADGSDARLCARHGRQQKHDQRTGRGANLAGRPRIAAGWAGRRRRRRRRRNVRRRRNLPAGQRRARRRPKAGEGCLHVGPHGVGAPDRRPRRRRAARPVFSQLVCWRGRVCLGGGARAAAAGGGRRTGRGGGSHHRPLRRRGGHGGSAQRHVFRARRRVARQWAAVGSCEHQRRRDARPARHGVADHRAQRSGGRVGGRRLRQAAGGTQGGGRQPVCTLRSRHQGGQGGGGRDCARRRRRGGAGAPCARGARGASEHARRRCRAGRAGGGGGGAARRGVRRLRRRPARPGGPRRPRCGGGAGGGAWHGPAAQAAAHVVHGERSVRLKHVCA
mmetsp:Transcript_9251/g.29336  ORF Transcript_9251/g.29336 Transcript_9251/m.29336 type:complete len:364 (+) Transcript_9251:165-1256(+)